jgi:hypothetical protein
MTEDVQREIPESISPAGLENSRSISLVHFLPGIVGLEKLIFTNIP